MRSVFAWDRLGRFCSVHPCLVLTGLVWAFLALFFPAKRTTVAVDLDRVCEMSGWVRSSLQRRDDRMQFELEPEQVWQENRRIQVAGRIQTGLLVKRTDAEIILKNSEGKQIRIPANEVELIVPQRKSLMPELLLREMTGQQVADLLAYLGGLK